MNENNRRIYLLDLARAFAAISVVLQHYQHFYLVKLEKFDRYKQPLYDIIGPLYNFGSQAVPFFYMLSGFIFFQFYFIKINKKEISFKNFFILRFSRLYPLHFFTLILTLVIQHIYFNIENNFFIFNENNTINFVKHLFLIQQWPFIGEISPESFNAPSFSISVELFLYLFFFIFSLKFMKNIFEVSIIILLSIFLYYWHETNLILGFVLFYYGGFIYHITKIILILLNKFRNLMVVLIFIINVLVFSNLLDEIFLNIQLSIQEIYGGRLMLFLYFVKLPLVIININIIQNYFNNLGDKVQFLGDISYTIYLIHFPLQIILFIINDKYLLLDYSNITFFLIYIFTVLSFSYIVYKYIELPSKIYIRNLLIKKNYEKKRFL